MKNLVNSVLMAGAFSMLMGLHPDCATSTELQAGVISLAFGVMFVPVYWMMTTK